MNSDAKQLLYRVGEGEAFLLFTLFSGAISTGFTAFVDLTGGVGTAPSSAIAASRVTLAEVIAIF